MDRGKSSALSTRLVVSVPARVHLTLIELGQGGYRRNGGIGFGIKAPARRLEFAGAPKFDLSGLAALGFSRQEIDRLDTTLGRVRAAYGLPNATVLIAAQGPGRHIGLGSGTAVTLACLELLFAINNVSLEPSELIRISGRGGTSGVGIHTYFSGGFIVDAGRKFDTEPFASSDQISQPASTPALLARYNMPCWPIGLVLLPCPGLTEAQEKDVFASLNTAPISASEVHEIAYHSIFGASAAVATSNYSAFCEAINALQQSAWKRREIAAHGDAVSSAIKRMLELGCDCVGLSSMGPGLFFLAGDFQGVLSRLRKEFPYARIESSLPANTGREIRHA